MNRHQARWALAFALAAGASLLPCAARELSFEERVKAQEAIERVYHAHRQGEDRVFEEAVPREVLEKEVRDYIAKSLILDQVWDTPVTGEMLRRESARIAAETQMPERLLELYAALQWDPFLVEECLARQVLVDRLTRNFFRGAPAFQVPHQRALDELKKRIANGVMVEDLAALERLARGPDALGGESEVGDDQNDTGSAFFSGSIARLIPLVEDELAAGERAARQQQTSALPEIDVDDATPIPLELDDDPGGSRVTKFRVPHSDYEDWFDSISSKLDTRNLVTAAFGIDALPLPKRAGLVAGRSGETMVALNEEGAGRWTTAFPERFPPPDGDPSAVWTGTELLIWTSGLRYDPATDTWSSIPSNGGLVPQGSRCSVWTGRELLIWGNRDQAGNSTMGARFNPSTAEWAPISTVGAPASKTSCVAVWTGDRMIVWGGGGDGARYDPEADAWSAMSSAGGPVWDTTAVWSGTEMLVWSGPASSGRYDPVSNSWRPISQVGAPEHNRQGLVAVWSGRELIVWGGMNNDLPSNGPYAEAVNTGARYNPSTDQWIGMSTKSAPPGGLGFAGVWTGSALLLWGGHGWDGRYLNDCWLYEPDRDKWRRMSNASAPEPRNGAAAVWTGTQMIIWGGVSGEGALATGGRFDPTRNRWTPTQASFAPRPRGRHSSVWTGNELIVWGGVSGRHLGNGTYIVEYDTGGRFDPTLTTWRPTSTKRAPSARSGHSAVWTGSLMIVWGGWTNDGKTGSTLRDGAEYDPIRDRWRSIPRSGGPSSRSDHAAVWTGREMIVWGGAGDRRGYRYNPKRRTWRRVSEAGAPTADYRSSALWTGTEMIVWGDGESPGGRYDATNDRWVLLPTLEGPGERLSPSVAWTGSEFLVWGGELPGGVAIDGGAAYDLATDSWRAMPSAGAPSARTSNSAVWTGDRLIVWGGTTLEGATTDSGGIYDPGSGTWIPTSLENAPPRRRGHSAVWTGDRMLVWGGEGDCSDEYCDGGGAFFMDAH